MTPIISSGLVPSGVDIEGEREGRHTEWKPIQTAPAGRRVIAMFWHGPYRRIVAAEARGDGGWQDIEDGSCVGWMPGQKKPGYWLCEAPEFPEAS